MTLYPIEAGNFKLDGGAMFGVVPKPLWEKTNPADHNNKIEMATRCLLIEDGKSLILIDTGFGNKQSEKFFSYYDLWGNYSIDNSLKKYGFTRNDITDVFFTHLHFDHCGGAIERKKNGTLSPAFKNAVFWVHEDHWNWAKNSNVREKVSFIPENINPIKESGQLKFIKGKGPIIKNYNFSFDILTFDGHTEKQMLPLLKYKKETYSGFIAGINFAKKKPIILGTLLIVGFGNLTAFTFESMGPYFAKFIYEASPKEFHS